MAYKHVDIYCDGACSGNPGPGGWGAVLLYKGAKRELSGYSSESTNNRMELTAAIMALNALKEPCDVHIYTDSAYLCNAFNNGWIIAWERNGWINAKKKPVENKDLWLLLTNKTKEHRISWFKVMGMQIMPITIYATSWPRMRLKRIRKLRKNASSGP